MFNWKSIALTLPLALAAAPVSAAAPAGEWQPTKPIRMLVGFAPGGGTDTTARAMGVKLGEIAAGDLQ